MFPFYSVFIVAIVFYLLFPKKHPDRGLALFFLYLALFVGLGDMIGGYDRYIYGEVFDTIADEMRESGRLSRLFYLIQGKEYGFFYWQVLLSFVTANRYIFILVTTLAVYVMYFISFKRYIEHYPLAGIVFLGMFYYFTMTYLRQVMAVGIVWLAIRYIWERKPYRFFGLVLLAYTFHSSALIFAPMYFVPIRKFSKLQIVWFMVLCLLIGMTPLPHALMEVSGEATGMAVRTHSYVEQDQGFRIEYVFEAVFFLWIFFRNYQKISKDAKTVVFFNMSIVFCGVLLIFMRFGQGGRLGWYYMMGD